MGGESRHRPHWHQTPMGWGNSRRTGQRHRAGRIHLHVLWTLHGVLLPKRSDLLFAGHGLHRFGRCAAGHGAGAIARAQVRFTCRFRVWGRVATQLIVTLLTEMVPRRKPGHRHRRVNTIIPPRSPATLLITGRLTILQFLPTLGPALHRRLSVLLSWGCTHVHHIIIHRIMTTISTFTRFTICHGCRLLQSQRVQSPIPYVL